MPFAAEVGASYILVVPGAVGRPHAYDSTELARSVETLRLVADLFVKHKVKAAIEPIRSAEVSFVHSVADAKAYIAAVSHPGVKHINGDVYHMQAEESHIGEAIVDAAEMLVNLHLADSNRAALGLGSIDLDTIIRALYLIGFNEDGRFVTPEPLGPGGDPYPAMYGNPETPERWMSLFFRLPAISANGKTKCWRTLKRGHGQGTGNRSGAETKRRPLLEHLLLSPGSTQLSAPGKFPMPTVTRTETAMMALWARGTRRRDSSSDFSMTSLLMTRR